jgi:hypothetical protein
MNSDLLTAMFSLIRKALADRLLIWATLGSMIGLTMWVTIRNPEPIRFVGSGLLIVVLLMVLYFSKKE